MGSKFFHHIWTIEKRMIDFLKTFTVVVKGCNNTFCPLVFSLLVGNWIIRYYLLYWVVLRDVFSTLWNIYDEAFLC